MKPDEEMLEVVICPECGKEEYYGMLHWLAGKCYCRQCIYARCEALSKWTRGHLDFTFPKYSDGINHTEKE